MNTFALDKLYTNRKTLIELSTDEILGTNQKEEYCRDKILEEIGSNKNLLKKLIEIEDEINGLASMYNKKAFYNGLSFGTNIASKILKIESEGENDGQDSWILQYIKRASRL